MKKIYLFIILQLFVAGSIWASCGGGQAQVVVSITPDQYPSETSWGLYDANTNALLDTGRIAGDTVCIGSAQCVKFVIYDAFGDGICCNYGHGSYTVTLNGDTVASGGSFAYSQYTYFNCPPGHDCTTPLAAVLDTMTAPAPETWYTFTPDSTGLYDIHTCDLANTCDTKIYIYDHCTGIVPSEDNAGTVFYNDDNCANYQSQITASLVAGTTYYIRIGDYLTSCTGHTINWIIVYDGPIRGCMDPTSCNYNPLATVSDSNCVYPPSPLCPAPDLEVVQSDLVNSLYTDTLVVGATNCYIGEGCLAGYGTRRLIRFTTHIRNIGDEDYYIGAPDTVGNQFVYDACHNHWHYVGYAEYLMFDANNAPVETGFKNGFCVLDLECGGGGQAKYGCGNMGITAGCGDIYSAGLDCQWIDITDIDTGNYTLVVRVNWDHSPDKLGHYEKTYSNNWAQVCFNLHYDNAGYKVYSILPNCQPYVDCAGDTFGNARRDCQNVCNGTAVRGDLNVSYTADSADLELYLNGLTNETLPYTICSDLNGDSAMTVTDAARLNGCILFNEGLHHHIGNYQNTHKHCDFPFNVVNPYDSVMFSIANVDWQHRYVDISVYNPTAYLLAYEFKMHGLVVDSVQNLAVGNYNPNLRSAPNGHITGIALDENSLYRQTAPLNFMRIYYSALTDTMVCIEKIIAADNSNYEEIKGVITGGCAVRPGVNVGIDNILSARDISIIPNPSNGLFDVYSATASLQQAVIQITDATGRLVYNAVNGGMSNNLKIDLSGHESGVYVLHIQLNGQSVIKKLVLTTQ